MIPRLGRIRPRFEQLEDRRLPSNIPIIVTSTNADGPGSLRQAMIQANSDPGPDVINFNIPGEGVHTIQPTMEAALPTITDALTIDGYTQPGARPNTLEQGSNAVLLIELDGSNAGTQSGITIDTDNCVIKGLVINRYTPYTKNWFYPYNGAGIKIWNYSHNNVISGNYVGTDATGKVAMGNMFSGVFLAAAGSNTIGGPSPADRNVISGNGEEGIYIYGFDQQKDPNFIQGNYIGTDASGTTPLPNGLAGIGLFNGACNITIGGTDPKLSNIIAFNGGSGIDIGKTGTDSLTGSINGNRVIGNSIFSNGGLGIDIGRDGVTPNDPMDADVGYNGFQNYPVLTSMVTDRGAGTTTVSGTLNSKADASFTVSLYANTPLFGTGILPYQGRFYLGSFEVNTGSDGNASFDHVVPTIIPGDQIVTATATDSLNSTSEFSTGLPVQDVNRPPDAEPDSYTIPTGGVLTIPAKGLLANDSDPDGTQPTAILVSHPSHGTLVGNALNADGSFSYTPNPAFVGHDTFTYRAFDGSLYSATATVTITVSPPPALLPDIVMVKATTTDAHSLTLSYQINNADVTQPVTFFVYRSDRPYITSNSVLFASASVDPSNLTVGLHPSVYVDLKTDLVPVASRPFILVLANPTFGSATIQETDWSNNLQYFRKFILGIVTHGFTPPLPFARDSQTTWVNEVVAALRKRHYTDVQPFTWIPESNNKRRGDITAAGIRLFQLIKSRSQFLLGLSHHDGDVVDIHAVAHSRGAVILGQALRLVSASALFKGSYVRATLLDPHAARNQGRYHSAAPLNGGLEIVYLMFQKLANDPRIVLPPIVKRAEVFYQHTAWSRFGTTSTERYLNLWGENTDTFHGNGTIINNTGRTIYYTNLTNKYVVVIKNGRGAWASVGHGEVPTWYMQYVNHLSW